MKEQKRIRCVALAQRVLAVAVLHYAEVDNKFILQDWAVYIDAVPGISHEDEKQAAAEYGDKQPRQIATLLFPGHDIEKYRG